MKIVKCSVIVAGFGWLLAASAQVDAQAQPSAPITSQTALVNPTRVRAKLDGFDLSPQSSKSANQIGGASHDLGSPRLYAPHAGKAFSVMPVFYWGTAEPAQKVTFRLTTLNGKTMCEVTTTADHVAYPQDGASLIVGQTYRWSIYPENDRLGGPPRPALISIVDGNERAAVEIELGKNPAAANSIFVNHRIWYDAVAGYTAALDQNPGDQDALKGRAAVYDQLPATEPLADADWSRVH